MSAGRHCEIQLTEFDVFSHQGCVKKMMHKEGIKRNIFFTTFGIRLEQTWVHFCLTILLVMMLLLNIFGIVITM